MVGHWLSRPHDSRNPSGGSVGRLAPGLHRFPVGGEMIHLHFKGIGPGDEWTIGPANSFRIAGNFIRDADSGDILARYRNHYWEVEDKFFTRYQCPENVWMHFEDAEGGKTDYYGPFATFSVTDGSVHNEKKLLAKFMDPTLLWHDTESDTYWQNLILSDNRGE